MMMMMISTNQVMLSTITHHPMGDAHPIPEQQSP